MVSATRIRRWKRRTPRTPRGPWTTVLRTADLGDWWGSRWRWKRKHVIPRSLPALTRKLHLRALTASSLELDQKRNNSSDWLVFRSPANTLWLNCPQQFYFIQLQILSAASIMPLDWTFLEEACIWPHISCPLIFKFLCCVAWSPHPLMPQQNGPDFAFSHCFKPRHLSVPWKGLCPWRNAALGFSQGQLRLPTLASGFRSATDELCALGKAGRLLIHSTCN